MPNKCGIVNCRGNYDLLSKRRIFKLPRLDPERQRWLAVIPPRKNFNVANAKSFFICEKHWPQNPPMKKLPGGTTRPAVAPSIFDVPASCLPTPQIPPRPAKQVDKQLDVFMARDRIKSFSEFLPDKKLHKEYNNVVITRRSDRCAFLFMSSDFRECEMTVLVENKSTLCSPLTCFAYKSGIRVPLGTILNPNNGLSSYSQFYAVVHTCFNYKIPLDKVLKKVVTVLQAQETEDKKKGKKIDFIINNLKLLVNKNFTVKDYCFAVGSFPHCNYEVLREYLVLPSRRKLQAVVSSVNVKDILSKTFAKLQKPQQKNVVLLVDEMKIRPTVAFSGGVLSGMAKNDHNAKATSMLCVMSKCLHRGPSIMVSVTPVHKLTASFQFEVVKQAAMVVEQAGGTVLGSITDNHKIDRLARHAASYLETLDVNGETMAHTCVTSAIDAEDATFIEDCTEPSLSIHEESSATYVAGWLEKKCEEHLIFNEEDELVSTEVSAFISEVSRGSLKIPHQTTFDLVRCGLAFITKARHRACCCRRLMMILQVMEDYNNLNTSDKLRRHVANVLLKGLHNLEKDQQKNAVLLQTSIKKARLSD